MSLASLLHPVAIIDAMREARALRRAALERAEKAAVACAGACRRAKMTCAARCDEIDAQAGERRGAWLHAKPLLPRGVRGGGLPASDGGGD